MNHDLGKDNVIYFDIGTRVLWRGKPGVIVGHSHRAYDYPVGYNVKLKDGNYIVNSAKWEIAIR